MKKIAVGISGGVDSAVSAALLKEQGYDVMGVYLECWRGPGCRTDQDRKDALDIALKLDIPFKVLDFKAAYKANVVDYFTREYQAGRTPNPDTMCNKEIKFGLFYDWAIKEGFDAIATGHYAQMKQDSKSKSQVANKSQTTNSCTGLFQGSDPKKDQSYFLYQLKPHQLEHVMFPIGHLQKSEVRAKAKALTLPVAAKPDSQGICFIGQVSVTDFLKSLGVREQSGDVYLSISPRHSAKPPHSKQSKESQSVENSKFENWEFDADPIRIGTHKGAWFYTIGQRHGFIITPDREARHILEKNNLNPSNLPPLFIIHKDVVKNVLVVTPKEQLYQESCTITAINWLQNPPESGSMSQNIHVRIRHGGQLIPSTITIHPDKNAHISFSEPVFAIAPGQAVVIYRDARLIGGGVIV